MNKKLIILIFLCIAVIVVGAIFMLPLFSAGGDGGAVPAGEQPEPLPEPEPVTVSILCTGDVMAHKTQLDAQKQADGTYDFTDNFEYIKHYVEEADIAICNLETTFGQAPYTGYPAFSSPDELAAALKWTGFDVVATANNHMLDRGTSGVLRTLEILKGQGFQTTGSITEVTDPRYCIYEANGIKVGVISYTYQNSTGDRRVSINGSIASEEAASHINSFNYAFIDEELAKIGDVVEQCRAAGAQIVVMFYHWGEEYQLSANRWQLDIAQKTIDTMDIDVIFGSHPHVLQQCAMVSPTVTGGARHTVPVFYSLGNCISNQRTETLNNKYTEEGVLARAYITIKPDTGEVIAVDMDAIPTWVDRYKSGGRTHYSIIPLDDALDDNPTLAVSGHLSRAKDAKETAYGILGIN
ncbi:MAG: CapA family protein [Firmicutes bacterium]|nr:CapA family protein [Bacillota bacterium]